MKLFIKIALTCLAFAMLALTAIFLWLKYGPEYQHICDIAINDDQEYIEVTEDTFCDPCCAQYFQIFRNGKPVNAHQSMFICNGMESDDINSCKQYELIKSKNGDIIALTTKDGSGIVYILQQFSTGFNYPSDEISGGGENVDRIHKKGEKVLSSLERDLGIHLKFR